MNNLLEHVSPFTAFHIIYVVTIVVYMVVSMPALLLSKRVWVTVRANQIGDRETVCLIVSCMAYWVAGVTILVVFGGYVVEQLKTIGY
jgi:uncharacterized membrane protein